MSNETKRQVLELCQEKIDSYDQETKQIIHEMATQQELKEITFLQKEDILLEIMMRRETYAAIIEGMEHGLETPKINGSGFVVIPEELDKNEIRQRAFQKVGALIGHLTPEHLKETRQMHIKATHEQLKAAERQHEERAQTLRHGLRGADMVASAITLELALKVHQETRLDGNPYSSHVIAVSSRVFAMRKMLGEELADEACAAGNLHDVLEDTLMSEDEIREILRPAGEARAERITRSTVRLSKKMRSRPGYKLGEEAYFAGLRGDVSAIIAKACDQIHNLSTSKPWDPEKRARYCDRNEAYMLPLLREARRSHPHLYDPLVLLSEELRTVIQAVRISVPEHRSTVENAMIRLESTEPQT